MHCFISLASAIWSLVRGPQIHEGSSKTIEDNWQFMAACAFLFLAYNEFSLKNLINIHSLSRRSWNSWWSDERNYLDKSWLWLCSNCFLSSSSSSFNVFQLFFNLILFLLLKCLLTFLQSFSFPLFQCFIFTQYLISLSLSVQGVRAGIQCLGEARLQLEL